jgi:ribosomal protein S18 acetylase RimI-like enzyme
VQDFLYFQGEVPEVTPSIRRVRDLAPDDLADLAAESERSGFRFVRRLLDEWVAGVNRFDRPGEALFVAFVGGRVVGVCGLNLDPYDAGPRVGRVRRLYVLSTHRRAGVGRRLVMEVIAAARGAFDRLRLRTDNPEATRFYERLGFRPCAGVGDCTHVLELGGGA